MKSQRLTAGLTAFSLVLLSACVSTSTGLGRDAGPVRLPTGVTLLESDEEQCQGAFHISEESVRGDASSDDFYVDAGENATFRLQDDDVNWTCIRDEARTFHDLTCPDASSHLRITRAATGGDVLLECFG